MWKNRIKSFFARYKKQLLIGLLAACVCFLAWMATSFVQHLKEPVLPACNAIPADVAWYVEFKDAQQIWDKIKTGNDIVTELRSFPYFGSLFSEANTIDSMVCGNETMKEISAGQSLIVCCRYNEANRPEFLFLMNLPDAHQQEAIFDFIKETWQDKLTLEEIESEGVVIVDGKINDGRNFTFTVKDGIFMLSSSGTMVRSAIAALTTNSGLAADVSFSKVRGTMGSKVDANVCLNLRQLGRCLGPYINKDNEGFTRFLNTLGQWAGMDLIIRKDELMLSGYMNAAPDNYLHIFRGEKGQKMTLTRYVPYNTAVMLYYGASDMQKLTDKQRQFSAAQPGSTILSIEDLEKRSGFNLRTNLFSWMGTEAAMVITETPSAAFRTNAFAVFNASRRKAESSLAAISVPAEILPATTEEEDPLVIRQIRIPELFPCVFGAAFSYITENYYFVSDEHVVFGNSPQALKNFLASRLSDKTLNNNENYKAFADNVSESASLCLYVNIRKSAELFKPMLEPSLKNSLDALTPQLRNFQAFAIQISSEKELFYTNVYLKYNPSYKDENPAVWETRVDSTVVMPPLLVYNTSDSNTYILIVDQLNHLYMLDGMGRIIWTYRADAAILGPVQIIQQSKPRETLLLFNTSKQLIMLDMKGHLAKNFPVTLRFPITSAVSALDYDQKGEFRLLFVCDDHKLYNYATNGKPSSGWSAPLLDVEVIKGVEYITMLGKEYLIVTDIEGRCHFYTRKGRAAFNPATTEFLRSRGAPFALYSDGARSRIITTDRKGRIIRVAPDGDWESITLREFSANHHFMYADFDGNELKDYIYTDSNTISVYNVNKRNIFELEFPFVASSGLLQLETAGSETFFGVVGQETKQIFLFNQHGWSPMNKFLTGSMPFATGILDQSGFSSLITTDGRTVYHYYLTDTSVSPF